MLVPFGELQQQVLLAVPAELRVVIYRRLMMRITEKLARAWRARALVTGEVIGQVASQTLENLTTIAEATTLEILRPLVGMDKDEIVAQAEVLGTYPISIIPDQDCCQLFTPRHPATRARRDEIERAEADPVDRRDGRRRGGRRRGGGVQISELEYGRCLKQHRFSATTPHACSSISARPFPKRACICRGRITSIAATGRRTGRRAC